MKSTRRRSRTTNAGPVMAPARLVLAALAMLSVSPVAQSEKPIYVQYEGFIRQADGSLILSFGYFNTGDADVAIPVNNSSISLGGISQRI